MRWSLTVCRFGGTAVKIHITFLLFLAWIGFSAWLEHGATAARDSLVFIVLLFLCVVLHEFGHILMARRFGTMMEASASSVVVSTALSLGTLTLLLGWLR